MSEFNAKSPNYKFSGALLEFLYHHVKQTNKQTNTGFLSVAAAPIFTLCLSSVCSDWWTLSVPVSVEIIAKKHFFPPWLDDQTLKRDVVGTQVQQRWLFWVRWLPWLQDELWRQVEKSDHQQLRRLCSPYVSNNEGCVAVWKHLQ